MGQNEGKMIPSTEIRMSKPESTSHLSWRVERMEYLRILKGWDIEPHEITHRPRDIIEFSLLGYKLALDQ